MGRPKHTAAQDAERRAEILAAAVEVLARQGFHATNIADIAERLGLGHGTLYRYFRNKLDLLEAIVDQVIAAIARLVTDEVAGAADTLEEYRAQLERIGAGFFAIFMEQQGLARLVLHEAAVVDPAVGARVRRALDLFASFTAAYLRNGQHKGFLRADLDVEVTARAINAMIAEGVDHVARSAEVRSMAGRWRRAVIDLMLDGMRSRPGRPRPRRRP